MKDIRDQKPRSLGISYDEYAVRCMTLDAKEFSYSAPTSLSGAVATLDSRARHRAPLARPVDPGTLQRLAGAGFAQIKRDAEARLAKQHRTLDAADVVGDDEVTLLVLGKQRREGDSIDWKGKKYMVVKLKDGRLTIAPVMIESGSPGEIVESDGEFRMPVLLVKLPDSTVEERQPAPPVRTFDSIMREGSCQEDREDASQQAHKTRDAGMRCDAVPASDSTETASQQAYKTLDAGLRFVNGFQGEGR